MSDRGMNRLLIVDDEPAIGAFVREVAEELGIEAKAVSSAKAFRDQFETFKPTIVSLDLQMPIETGIELIEWLRRQPSPPKLMLMSGNPTLLRRAADLAVAARLELVATLHKPAPMDDLFRVLSDTTGASDNV